MLAPLGAAQPATPSPSILLSASTLTVKEGSAAQTYTVRLSTPPATTVTIAITGQDAGLAVTAPPLTFGPADYNTAKTVTVSVAGGDDATLEGSTAYTLVHTASGQDPSYGGVGTARAPVQASLTVYAADNDAGLAAAQSGGSTAVAEQGVVGVNDTVTLSLGAAPASTVTVRLAPSGPHFDVDRHVILFTPANWHVPVAVKVFANRDDVAEGSQAGTLGITASGPAPYGGLSQGIPVTVTDDDVVALRLLDQAGNAALAGSPPAINAPAANSVETVAASYSVALGSQPAAQVNVSLTVPDHQATLSSALLVFTPADWNTPKAVTVTGAGDRIDEGSNTAALVVPVVHNVTSADAAYATLPNQTAAFRYLDDDIAGYYFAGSATINATPATLSVSEATPNTPATYTVGLSSEPVAAVNVSFAGNAQMSVTPAFKVFNATNWQQTVTVEVRAIQDEVDEATFPTGVAQSVDSADGRYKGILSSVAVNVADNDVAALQPAVPNGFHVQENGTNGTNATFTLRLSTKPTAMVNVTLTAAADSDGAQVDVVPGVLHFTPADWNVTQNVTVEAIDDGVSELTKDVAVTLDPSSNGDSFYNALSATAVTVKVLDDDGVAVITESDGGTIVQEGSAADDVYTVRLISKPTSTVYVNVTAPAGLLVNGAQTAALKFVPEVPQESTGLVDALDDVLVNTLNLDPLDLDSAQEVAGSPWNQPQRVHVTAPNDPANSVTGSLLLTITHGVESDDEDYDGGIVRDVLAYRLDDDPGILLVRNHNPLQLTEAGATDTYTLRLATAPAAGESVAIGLHPDSQVSVPEATVYFDSFAWDFAQTVTVSAVQDSFDEAATHSGTIRHTVATNDDAYRTKTVPDVAATIADDDTAGVTLAQSNGNTAVTEGGAADSYTIVLDTVPPGTVTITVSVAGGQAIASPASMSFTPQTWNQPQTVTITAVNDNVAEGPQSATITHGLSGWAGITVPNVVVAITDNDVAGVPVTETGGSTTVTEGGAGDGLQVRLTSQPLSDVTVTLASTDPQLRFDPATLTFTPGNWATTQQAWVWVPQDAFAQGTHAATVTFSVASGDSRYNAFPVGAKTLTLVDNDVAGLTLVESGGSTVVTEGGAGDSLTIALSSKPTADVTVTLAPADGQVTASPATHVFTTTNWAAPRTVTFGAVNDGIAEDSHADQVVFTFSSADSVYNGLSVPGHAVFIIDND